MFKGLTRLASCAAIFAATLAPVAANAVVIDFEDPNLVGLYGPTESFTQSGFVMTQFVDFATVDTTMGLATGAPTGNPTQFYFSSNDGYMEMTSANGLPFSLNSFDAAFIPQSNPTTPQTLYLLAYGASAAGSAFDQYGFFALGNTTSGASSFPFLSFSGFAPFTNLIALDFQLCAVVGTSACGIDTDNNAQFALDNINVSIAAPVPEPETTALMALGLVVLTAVARRRRSR